MSPIRTKASHPVQQDLAHVKTDLRTHLLAEGASPVRKQARRQSLPARLSSTGATKYSVGRGGKKKLSLGSEGPPGNHASDCDPEHLGLSSRQKRYYTLMMKVVRRVTTLPLPMMVTSVNGRGDFFDRGDIAPRQATVIVRGLEDPLVQRLELGKLLSAALAERARRRNEQMATFVSEALRRREDTAADTHGGDGGSGGGSADKACTSSDGDQDEDKEEEISKRWWIKLCANKHLKDDVNLKRVRDGEPLGSVADGVEWALRQKIRAYRGRVPGERSGGASTPRYREDVAILVKVASQWASVLTWSQVANGTWSYADITTRMLKQGIYCVEVVVEIGGRQTPAGRGDRRSSRENCNRREAWWQKRPHLPRKDDAGASGSGEGCAPPGDVIEPADEEGEGTLLWRPCARDVSANLARVFREEGKEEAVKEAATTISRRIEVMARGCAVLRVALEDLIEGKVSAGMQEGDNSNAVTDACLQWLKVTAAAKIAADWARNIEAVSQAVACIGLSIRLEAKVSDAVAIWLKSHARRRRGDVTLVPSVTSGSESEGAVTEDAFVELKRAEARQAQETDTVGVMVHHALYLLLPCQPVKFHFVWGRFMRFYHERNLYQHVARYYTDGVRKREDPSSACAKSSATGGGARAAEERADGSRRPSLSTASARGKDDDSTSSNTGSSHEVKGSRRSSSEGVGTLPRSVCRQVARNLVKPRHMDNMEFRPSYFFSAATGDVQRRRGTDGGPRAEAAAPAAVTAKGGGDGDGHVSALSHTEAAVANECLVSLLAMHGTGSHLATGPQVAAALRREGFPNEEEALTLLRDADALRGKGVKDRLWRGRRGAALVRARVRGSVFARLPFELFRNVLVFLAS